MANMFIPSKIRVGFQNRSDTFTGKLAYVIYYDEKGKIRKETSWKSWCDSKIEVLELDNAPHNNYVFNKGVKRDGHWGSGRSVIRVHDPRNFEFEISVDNLIGLLMHSDVSKRDIVEECVFAWLGAELILLPVNSEEYQKSVDYTDKQSQKISAKELVAGHTYSMKKNDTHLTYLGYYPWYDYGYNRINDNYQYGQAAKGKKHVFHDGEQFVVPSPSTLASVISSEVNPETYATLVDKFHKSKHAYRYIELILGKSALKHDASASYRNINGYKSTTKVGEYCHVNVIQYGNGMNGMNGVKFAYFDVVKIKDQITIIPVTNKGGVTYNSFSYGYNRALAHTEEYSELARYLNEIQPDGAKTAKIDIIIQALTALGYVGNMSFITEKGNHVPCQP
jgi:hypothetical protein